MKRFWTVFLTLALMLAFVVPAQAEFQDMWAKVYKWNGNYNADGSAQLTAVTSGIQFKVLRSGNDSLMETLYVYGKDAYTSLTNPVTSTYFDSATYCDGLVKFRVDPTDATNDRYVDLIVVDTSGGYTQIVQNFDKYTHAIVIDERPNVVHHGQTWFSYTTTDQTSTGVTLLSGTLLHRVITSVTTNLDETFIGIGTTGSTQIVKFGDSLASTGFVQTSYESEGSPWKLTWSTHSGGYFIYNAYGSRLTNDTALTFSISSGGTPAAKAQTGSIHYWFSYGPR
jgi:hypothetical protein